MDQTFLFLINEKWTNPALDLFMAAMSDVEIWKPLLILVVLVAVIFGGFKGRSFILCMLLSLLIAEQVTGLLKSAIDRPRPKQVQRVRMVELQKARPKFLTIFKPVRVRYSDRSDQGRSGPSFPSGHATNNTVIAVCLTLFYPRRGWLYWFVAAAVGYSRIYLGAHWPSDVLATVFLAAGETLFVLAALELLWRWAGPKWAAQIYQHHPALVVRVGQGSNLPDDRSQVRNVRDKE